jgi:hypothetical protein
MRTFARKVLAGYLAQGEEIGDIDGATLQEYAEECGLLVATMVAEPCGEFCGCAEFGEFPLLCYKPTAALSAAERKE